jgi:hypothetical protein
MAPKKKPLTVGKGTSYTRPVTPGSNPRPVSAKPSQASKVRAAQKTTSSGITRRPDGRPQTEGRGARQATSTASVTKSGGGTSGSAKVTTGRGMAPMAAKAARTVATLAKAAKMVGPVGAAAAVLAPRKLADGTLKGKPTGNPQGPAVPKRLTQGGMDKGSFDDAFRQSRQAKKKTFTWRGKKYNTKLRGEK